MDVRQISFRLLQVFVVVVRTGSVTRAAAQLHLTQPTVSLQLKRLADAVGAPLLESRGGVLRPTFVGEELFRAARDVLNRFEDFGDFVSQAGRGHKGRFSIGVVSTAEYVLPRLLGGFYLLFPDVEVVINVGNRDRVLQRHREGADDLYLFSHPPDGDGTLAARFLANPLVMLAPPDHWTAGRRQISMTELTGERFLVREPGSGTRMVFENWLRERGVRLARIMQVESNEVIRLGVESGLGLAVLSEHTLSAGAENLTLVDVAGFPLASYWYLVCHNNRRLPEAARQFVNYIDCHLDECVDERYVRNELAPLLHYVQEM